MLRRGLNTRAETRRSGEDPRHQLRDCQLHHVNMTDLIQLAALSQVWFATVCVFSANNFECFIEVSWNTSIEVVHGQGSRVCTSPVRFTSAIVAFHFPWPIVERCCMCFLGHLGRLSRVCCPCHARMAPALAMTRHTGRIQLI